jgi:Lrp/AsnC family transcriptional regulator
LVNIPNQGVLEEQPPMDTTDIAILKLLQSDTSLSLDDIAIRVGASKTPIWNRIKRLKESGVIKREVAIIDAESVGLDTCFFVLVINIPRGLASKKRSC